MPKASKKSKAKGSTRSAVSGQYVSPEGADPATTYREGRDEFGARGVGEVTEVLADGSVEVDVGGAFFPLPPALVPPDVTAGERLEIRVSRKP